MTKRRKNVVFVVAIVTVPSGNAYMGRQMPQRDEEFNQIQVVSKCIVDVTEMSLT